MKTKAFVVHLKRAKDRSPQVARLIADLAVPADIIDAVDGHTLTDAEASAYRRGLHRPGYPFELRRTEIACFLSHRKAWQAIVDEDLDFGLVLEDDVSLEPGFAHALDFALEHATPLDYVRFPRWMRGESGRAVAANGQVSLIEPSHVGLGMQAELIGRDAAERLLRFTRNFDRPVDTTIQMNWLHGVRVLCARPIVIEEVDHLVGGTVVQGKSKGIVEILSREWRRGLYRAQLRLAAMRGHG